MLMIQCPGLQGAGGRRRPPDQRSVGAQLSAAAGLADFHGYLFQQRVVEAMQMLRALGAVELDIEHIRGRSTMSEIEEGRRSWTGSSGSWSNGRRRERSQQVLAHFEYPVTAARPRLPGSLVWAMQEPLWMEIADARLSRGLIRLLLRPWTWTTTASAGPSRCPPWGRPVARRQLRRAPGDGVADRGPVQSPALIGTRDRKRDRKRDRS
jgi:hypothetical protein